MTNPAEVQNRSLAIVLNRRGADAIQLPQYLARLYAEACPSQIIFNLRQSKEIHGAACGFEAYGANCSPQSPGTGPRREKSCLGKPADDLQSWQRVGYVIPKSNRDHQVKLLLRLPVQHVTEHELAAVGDAFFFRQLCPQFQHLGREIDARNVRASFGQTGDKATGSASDVAYLCSSRIPGLAHHPFKALINVAAQPAIQSARNRVLVAGVDGIELICDVVPVFRDLLRFVSFYVGSRHRSQSPWLNWQVRFPGNWYTFRFAKRFGSVLTFATNLCSAGGGNSNAQAVAAAPDQSPTDGYRSRRAALLFPPAAILNAYTSEAAGEDSRHLPPAGCVRPGEMW